jgi:hypothetical protein
MSLVDAHDCSRLIQHQHDTVNLASLEHVVTYQYEAMSDILDTCHTLFHESQLISTSIDEMQVELPYVS